jgi:predicted regulator of Ras-like GTPase activity (Roadblock/LC7/MglB family)
MEGFEGTISGLGLREVIQLHSLNRFSGCITVQSQDRVGLVFFRQGSLVHAEYDNEVGESALSNILRWPAGRFSLQTNVTTTSRTIGKSLKELFSDEKQGVVEFCGNEARFDFQPRVSLPGDVIKKINNIAGVVDSALQTKDGVLVGDKEFEAEKLAGQASYLAMVGRRLGSVFQTGELRSGSVQGFHRHLMVYSSKNHYLSILARGEVQIGTVDSQARKILSRSRLKASESEEEEPWKTYCPS